MSASITDTAGKTCAVKGLGNSPAQTQRVRPQFSSEEALEAAIAAAMQRMCEAPTREGKMRHWREMCRLIDQRTPARRRFMERLRSLKT